MTPNLDEIRQLVSAASKGPTRLTIIEPPIDAQVEHIRDILSHGSGPVWGVGLPEHALTVLGDDPDRPDHMVTTCLTGNGPTSEANANLYAASHELIPALCDEVERLRAENAKLRESLDSMATDVQRLADAMPGLCAHFGLTERLVNYRALANGGAGGG